MAEFERWLHKHHRHLMRYAPDEIARLALVAGFSLSEICGGVSDRVTHIKRLMDFWESPHMGQWLRVASYEHGVHD